MTAIAPPLRRRAPLIGLLAADGISRAGNAITMIAVPLYVLSLTGSPLATGFAGVFATVPIIIGGALGGVLVDRFGWRRSSVVADAASGLTVLAIPVLAGSRAAALPAAARAGLPEQPARHARFDRAHRAAARPRRARRHASHPRDRCPRDRVAHRVAARRRRRRRARRAVRPGQRALRQRRLFRDRHRADAAAGAARCAADDLARPTGELTPAAGTSVSSPTACDS